MKSRTGGFAALQDQAAVSGVQLELWHTHAVEPSPFQTSPLIVVTGSDEAESLSGSNGDDTISGGLGSDTLVGGEGDDRLFGLRADGDDASDTGDILLGGDGDDYLAGQFGDNTLVGGAGVDTAQLIAGESAGREGIRFDLSGYQPGSAVSVDNLHGGHDLLTSIERFDVIGTDEADTIRCGSGDDRVVGNGGADKLWGGDGSDQLFVEEGSGTLRGGGGDDRLAFDFVDNGHFVADGGAGDDRLDVFVNSVLGMPTGYTLVGHYHHGVYSLMTQESSFFSLAGRSVEGLTIQVYDFGATLTGGGQDDQFYGYGALRGLGGDDLLQGGGVLQGGDGADTLVGSRDADTLTGGAGHDLYGFRFADLFGVDVVDLSSFDTMGGAHVVDYGSGIDSISGFEGVYVFDTVQAETITGSGGDDVITSSAGADLVHAGAGDDLVKSEWWGEPGANDGGDTLDGGQGRDVLTFVDAHYGSGEPGLVIDLDAGTVTRSIGGADTIVGFEAVTGSRYADTILGSGGAEVLDGGSGADSLAGSGGRDTLVGDDGTDTIQGGAAADLIDGGAGPDVLSGGAGADRFRFSLVSDSFADAPDRITDLANSDIIDLSRIDADAHASGDQAFHLVDAFTGSAGELAVVLDASDGTTLISADTDGDGRADIVIQADGDHVGYDNFVL